MTHSDDRTSPRDPSEPVVAHDHDHSLYEQRHRHDHRPVDFGRAFAIGVTLNLALVVAQAIYGVLANSVALLADAAHNFSDVGDCS